MPSTEKVSEVRWLLAPDALIDHFKVMRPLGKGGMAEVYLARDTKLGRKVALKLIRPDVLATPDAVERFLFEARATAKFNHPHIVTIYAVGEQGGRPYVALEYLEGQTLRERIDGERLSVTETIRHCLAIAEALDEAHRHSVLHRDLKPENVMLSRDGRLRVLDFGLARVVRAPVPAEAAARAELPTVSFLATESSEDFESQHQKMIGTPAYMAPEQWNQAEVTAAVDVWALGVMLFELLSGRRPYDDRSSVKLAVAICSDDPAPRIEPQHKVPAELCDLVERCLAKTPGQRPAAGEVARRLQRFLAQDRETLSTEESPFRGLLPFGEQHRHFFFGRDSEVNAFLERLRSEPLLPVLGPSGAGKSSFVQAGVIPRLRERGPLVVIQLRPGREPFAALASRVVAARHQASRPISTNSPFGPVSALESELELHDDESRSESERLSQQLQASPHLLNIALGRLGDRRHSQVVLFVDQLEELYTLVEDDRVRVKFMQAICTAADDPALPVRVIFTLREEFLSRLAEGVGVREALTQMTVLRSPGREALREILTRPLQAVGYRYDDEQLVEQMIDEVAGEVSSLPLLQFAGQELWQARDREQRALPRSAFEAMGGVAGALAQHADGVLGQLTSDEVNLARSMLLRLVTAEGTRKVLDRDRLIENLEPRAGEVLKRLTASRLVTTKQSESGGEGELELAHESLIVTWSRLRRWIEESKEELVFLHEVGQAAELWEKRGQREAELWRGDALRDAERAAAHCTSELSERIKKFLDASKGIEQRSVWLKRVALVAIVALLASVAGVFVWKEREASGQRDLARTAEAQARSSEREARTNLSAALAQKAAKAETVYEALLYAAGSLAQEEHPLARGVLLEQLMTPRPKIRWQSSKGVTCFSLAHDLRRKRLACATETEGLVIWDLATGREVARPDTPDSRSVAVVYSRDLRSLVTVNGTGAIIVRDAGTFDEVRRLDTSTGTGGTLDLSGDGSRLVFASQNGTVVVVRTDAFEEIARRSFDCATGAVAVLSPDRSRIAVGCSDGKIFVWTPADDRLSISLVAHKSGIADLAFSPDGALLVSSSSDEETAVWDARTWQPQKRLTGQKNAIVNWMEFLPDGTALAVAGQDGLVRFLEPRTLTQVRPAIEHVGFITAAAISADHSLLFTAGWDGDLIIWSLPSGAEVGRISGYGWGQHHLDRTRDGRYLLDQALASALRVRRWDDGVQLLKLGSPALFANSTFDDGDRRILASGAVLSHDDYRNVIDVWEFSPDRHTRAREYQDPFVYSTMLDARYRGRVVRRDDQGALCAFDVEAGRCETLEATKASQRYWEVFSVHGDQLAFTDQDNSIVLFDLVHKRRQAVIKTGTSILGTLRFAPDGKSLAAAGSEGALYLADLAQQKPLTSLVGHQGLVRGLDFSPDGRWLASGGYDGTLRIWEVASSRELLRWSYRDVIWSVLFASDGKSLATAGMDATVKLWDLPLDPGPAGLNGFKANVRALAFSTDSRSLCGLDKLGSLICRDLARQVQRTQQPLQTDQLDVIGLSEHGSRVFAKQRSDGTVVAIETATGETTILAPANDQDYRRAISDQSEQAVIACNSAAGTTVLTGRDTLRRAVETEEKWSVSTGECADLTFSPDDRHLSMSARGTGASVFELDTGSEVARFPIGGCATYVTAISPDGKQVAAAGCSKIIQLFDVEAKRLRHSFLGHNGWIYGLTFSADGQYLASVDHDNSLRIWDTTARREVARLGNVQCSTRNRCVRFSPDGHWLAVASQDNSVRLLDLRALAVPPDQVVSQVTAESSLTLDGVDVVPDPERLKTRFVSVPDATVAGSGGVVAEPRRPPLAPSK